MLKSKFLTISCLLFLVTSLFSAEIHDCIAAGDLAGVGKLIGADSNNLELKNDRLFTPLNWAAAKGKYEIFLFLLESGADIETVDIDGSDVLINAAASGNLEMVRFLVEEKNCDIGYTDNNGVTPFLASCGSGNIETIKYFVEKGADTRVRSVSNGTPLASATYSGNADAVKYLLDLGCEHDVTNQWGVAPVHYAAYRGQTEMLKIMMQKGVDIFAETMNRETPFIWAVVARRFETADFLLANGENVNRKLTGGITPAFSAFKLQPASFDYLLEKGAEFTVVDTFGNTVLHRAVMGNNYEAVVRLIELGLDVNAINDNGITVLTNACYGDSIDVLQVLLDNGARVVTGECRSESGCTGIRSPLHLCVSLGKIDFLELLMKHVDSIDLLDEFQRTPLHLAAVRGQKDVVKMLLAEGADVNAKDCFKRTPLYYSKIHAHTDVSAFLEENEAKSGKLEKKFRQNLLGCSLKKHEAVIYFLNHSGWAIKTANNLLIIDYWSRGTKPQHPCLANGWIDPQEIKDLDVTVLVSHDHPDHYDPIIWTWREIIPDIQYILGMEAPGQEGYSVIEPHTTKNFGDLKVTAIESNDAGVGFVIEADGITILHPGDHANETSDFSGTYWQQMEYVNNNFPDIDISMMPIRGCGLPDVESVRLGVIRTLRELQPKVFLPMHSIDEALHYRDFIENLKDEGIKKTRLYYPIDRGHRFIYRNGKLI